MITSTLHWQEVSEGLPDDETTVHIVLDDGEPWTGFLRDEQWYYVTGDPIQSAQVLLWAHYEAPDISQIRRAA